MSTPSPAIRPPSRRNTFVLAAVLFLLEVLIMNQGVIAGTLAIYAFIALPHALIARKFAGARASRTGNLAIYLVAAALALACIRGNNTLARHRAEVVIAAVKAYHAENNRYPTKLEELVPRYLDSVPLAKYTLVLNKFTYYGDGQKALLFYVGFPPFGRPSYSFASGRWGYID